MSCDVHQEHQHQHGDQCGHTRILHAGHVDYLHDGHLHNMHAGHVDEHRLEVGGANPDAFCERVTMHWSVGSTDPTRPAITGVCP